MSGHRDHRRGLLRDAHRRAPAAARRAGHADPPDRAQRRLRARASPTPRATTATVLNVPAARMSAYQDDPDDLVRVGATSRPTRTSRAASTASTCAPSSRRRRRALRRAAGARDRRGGRGCARARGALELALAGGERIACDRAVLAARRPRRARPPCALPDDPRVVADPWAPGALDGRAGARHDADRSAPGRRRSTSRSRVCARSPAARVVAMVSRHGRLPFAHLPGLRERRARAARSRAAPLRLRRARAPRCARTSRATRAAGYDWRDALDGLRPRVPALWAPALRCATAGRFLRERARAWEIRRHRMAPEVGAEVRALRAYGPAQRRWPAASPAVRAAPRRRRARRSRDGRT